MTAPTRQDWTEANQRLLTAELARIKAVLGEAGVDGAAGCTEVSRRDMPGPAAIDSIGEMFGLSAFEKDILLLAAGVEMDSGLAAACADVSAPAGRHGATFRLALARLPEPHWSALTPAGPLRRWRLIELDDGVGLTSARLRIDERILHYLAGVHYVDARLQPLLRPVVPPGIMAPGQRRVAEEIVAALEVPGGSVPLVQLSGDDADGQQDVAAHAIESLRGNLQAIDAADLPSTLHESESLATLWQREAALSGSALLIEKTEGVEAGVVQRVVERIGSWVVVAGREPLELRRSTIRFRVDRPGAAEQRQLWHASLGAAAERLDGGMNDVASQYRFSARRICEAATRVAPLLESDAGQGISALQASLKIGAPTLDSLAQSIEPMARWNDLVLPEAQKSTLRQIVSHVRHRLRVYHDWGFADKSVRGLGISTLFSGESGTGKTMAAEVLAGELGLELYGIDLSAVVSKYIGETEKNLRRLFDAAEENGAVLLFDEADALFGKRSEVKDSHDRYANIEVSYLLQRMEVYRGLAILTTNLKKALDTAFQRRLRFVVQFPFPDQQQRERIWRGIFPAATPLDGIDYAKLARLSVAGGHIRNIALDAAFLAAEAGESIDMHHLLGAARANAAKRERSLSGAETRGWV